MYWNLPPVILIALTGVYCGIIIFAKYHNCDPISMGMIKRADQLMPYYVMDSMAHVPGIAGLFTAGVFSGALSTLSSGFNSLAAVTWDDFLKGHLSKMAPKSSANLTKAIAATYGIISVSMAFLVGKLGTVFQASLAISGALRGPLFGLFCLGIFMPFTNKHVSFSFSRGFLLIAILSVHFFVHQGALAGMISGFGVSLMIAFGSIISPRPKSQLPVYTHECSADVYHTYGYKNATIALLPWEYQPR